MVNRLNNEDLRHLLFEIFMDDLDIKEILKNYKEFHYPKKNKKTSEVCVSKG